MMLRFTILGCGASTGVPRIDGNWGDCDPANPKNRRRRCCMLAQRFGQDGVTSVLVDTGPDLREQILSANIQKLDAVLYTHDHADHTHGIDDLRILTYRNKKLIDVYFDMPTGEILQKRFDYCFATPPGSNYPPIVRPHIVEAGQMIAINGAGGEMNILPFKQQHGDIDSLGFRIGGLAYSPDICGLPDESLEFLQGLDVWIVDGLRYSRHPSHFSVEEAVEWVGRIRPKRAVITHLTMDLDYETLRRNLPEGIEPAYDGMQIELAG